MPKIINKSLMKIERKDFLIHANFLTMITISLIYYGEKVFIFMNIWITGKNSETLLHEKEDLCSHIIMKYITRTQKTVCQD